MGSKNGQIPALSENPRADLQSCNRQSNDSNVLHFVKCCSWKCQSRGFATFLKSWTLTFKKKKVMKKRKWCSTFRKNANWKKISRKWLFSVKLQKFPFKIEKKSEKFAYWVRKKNKKIFRFPPILIFVICKKMSRALLARENFNFAPSSVIFARAGTKNSYCMCPDIWKGVTQIIWGLEI